MKPVKFIVFSLSVLSVSVVVFNNLAQLSKEIFNPIFNLWVWAAFGGITLITTTYTIYNWKSR